MKVTCGTDIIEIDRIKNSIEELGDKFLDRVFTKKEIDYCESKEWIRIDSIDSVQAGDIVFTGNLQQKRQLLKRFLGK